MVRQVRAARSCVRSVILRVYTESVKILSFLFPITLERALSLSGEEIRVREIGGKKRLDIARCPQSNTLFRRIWGRVIGELTLGEKGDALILGLGGGDLIKLFAKRYPKWKLTVIELEPEVIRLSRKYFEIKSNTMVRIINMDALNYLKKKKGNYDIIIEDIYDGDIIPKWVAKESFINILLSNLRRKGKIVFNYASYTFKKNDYSYFENLLTKFEMPHRILKYYGHRYFVLG